MTKVTFHFTEPPLRTKKKLSTSNHNVNCFVFCSQKGRREYFCNVSEEFPLYEPWVFSDEACGNSFSWIPTTRNDVSFTIDTSLKLHDGPIYSQPEPEPEATIEKGNKNKKKKLIKKKKKTEPEVEVEPEPEVEVEPKPEPEVEVEPESGPAQKSKKRGKRKKAD